MPSDQQSGGIVDGVSFFVFLFFCLFVFLFICFSVFLFFCFFVFLFFCFFVFLALFIDLWTDKVQPLSRYETTSGNKVLRLPIPTGK